MKLIQFAQITLGHPFRGKITERTGSNIRVIQMKDTSVHCGINWQTVSETEIPGRRKPDWLKLDDILFVARGSNNYAVRVNKALQKVVASPHFFIISVDTARVLPEFLVWQLNDRAVQRYFERESEGSLTKSIRRSVLEATPIVVPSLAKQQKILSLLTIIRQQQRLHEQLINNSKMLIDGIASQLLQEPA